ncbi:Negative elongation factor D [Aphelenchoides bicaudatus]|nr:Negative elongation factor D [Aphelenchoides bicaudatus]
MDQSTNDEPTISSLESLFSSEDFILEPQVMSSLVNYYELGGDPDQANKLLTDSYKGLAPMANLLGCWLSLLESDEQPSTSKKSTTAINLKDIESSPTVKKCFEEMASSMISKNFNPEAADKIFEDESSEDLISHSSWRHLIYQLSEQYPQCLMLNFAVKLASDAGFQHEISNVTTAVQQLEIFSRVFLSAVEQVLRNFKYGEKTKKFDDVLAEIIRVSNHSENCYLFAQSILRVMKLRNGGKASAACQYISQTLRKNQKRPEALILLIGLLNSPNDTLPQNVVNSFQTMLYKQALNPADVNQLYQAYFEPNSSTTSELVRDPVFIDILINSLFNVKAKLNDEYKPKYVFLLAYASTVCESIKGGFRVQTKMNLDFVRERILELLNILHCSDDLLPQLQQLLRLIKHPVLARCTLHFIETTILKDDFLAEPQQSHLILVDQIVIHHPNLRHVVFTMLQKFYENQSLRDEIAEIIMSRQRVVIDRFVHMIGCDYVLPVLELITRMYQEGKIDVSLVRHFGVEVLDMVDEPYSNEFVSSIFPIVTKTEVFDHNTLLKYPQVSQFIDRVAGRK